MKKSIILLACILLGNFGFAQKVITRSGEIKFEGSMPGIEEIAATNKTSSCVLDQATGEMGALSLIKAFKFKSPLMEEHFNENYMESTKFPKATFKGKIKDFDASKLTATRKEYVLEGDLTIHGVTKKVTLNLVLSTKDSKVIATCNFVIKPQDYGIEIPSIVKSKIAENIKTSFNFLLEKQ
jgi:hypothetical protein